MMYAYICAYTCGHNIHERMYDCIHPFIHVTVKAPKPADGCVMCSPRDTDVWPCVCEHGCESVYILTHK